MPIKLSYIGKLVFIWYVAESVKGEVSDWRESLFQRLAQANQSRKQVSNAENGSRSPITGNQYPVSQNRGSSNWWDRLPSSNSENSNFEQRNYWSQYGPNGERNDFSRLSDWRNRFVEDTGDNKNPGQARDWWSSTGGSRSTISNRDTEKRGFYERFRGGQSQQRGIWRSPGRESEDSLIQERGDWKQGLLEGFSEKSESGQKQDPVDWKDRLHQQISVRRSENGPIPDQGDLNDHFTQDQGQTDLKERLYQMLSGRRSGNSQYQNQNNWNDRYLQSSSRRQSIDSDQDAWKDRLFQLISSRRPEMGHGQNNDDWKRKLLQMFSGAQSQGYQNQDQGDPLMSLFSRGLSGNDHSMNFKNFLDRIMAMPRMDSQLKGVMPQTQLFPF